MLLLFVGSLLFRWNLTRRGQARFYQSHHLIFCVERGLCSNFQDSYINSSSHLGLSGTRSALISRVNKKLHFPQDSYFSILNSYDRSESIVCVCVVQIVGGLLNHYILWWFQIYLYIYSFAVIGSGPKFCLKNLSLLYDLSLSRRMYFVSSGVTP